jgi:hypothetical protein
MATARCVAVHLRTVALSPCGRLFEELCLSVKLKRRSTRSKEQPREASAKGPASPQGDVAPAPPTGSEPGKPDRKKGVAA